MEPVQRKKERGGAGRGGGRFYGAEERANIFPVLGKSSLLLLSLPSSISISLHLSLRLLSFRFSFLFPALFSASLSIRSPLATFFTSVIAVNSWNDFLSFPHREGGVVPPFNPSPFLFYEFSLPPPFRISFSFHAFTFETSVLVLERTNAKKKKKKRSYDRKDFDDRERRWVILNRSIKFLDSVAVRFCQRWTTPREESVTRDKRLFPLRRGMGNATKETSAGRVYLKIYEE